MLITEIMITITAIVTDSKKSGKKLNHRFSTIIIPLNSLLSGITGHFHYC
jgi:hypothetical protein